MSVIPSEVSDLKIEAGKSYVTKSGRVVGPLLESISNPFWPWHVYDEKLPGGCVFWRPDGQLACHGSRVWVAEGFELVSEAGQ